MTTMFHGLRNLLQLASVLAAAALPGCGDPSAPSGAEEPAPTRPERAADAVAPNRGSRAEGPAPTATLTMVWGDWEPAHQLRTLCRDFTAKTGIAVDLRTVPWPRFQQTAFTEFTGRGATYDIVIGDSQWLGKGASEGHYLDLTDWMKTHIEMDAITPSSLAAYCEYPKGAGRYWAVPCEIDACGFAYRRDLFENPDEKAAFKAKYGAELAAPRTWEALRDVAEFFTRPERKSLADGKETPAPLYGLSLWLGREYDGATMGYQQAMWSWGGEWGDPATFKTRGFINNPSAVAALEFYRGLVKFTPPGSTDAYWEKSITLFQQGTVAMSMNYFAFFPNLTDPDRNPHAKVTGFFACPAKAGKEDRRAVSLGGQGLSIVSYIPPARQEIAKRFLEWFSKQETQLAWTRLGGFSSDKRILAGEGFLNATPYNRAFAESLPLLRDFWSAPEYAKLLDVSQRHLHAAITGAAGAKESLDRIAEEHETIFREAGHLRE